MIKKICDIHQFDKNKKDKCACHAGLKDHFHGRIILDVDESGGVTHCSPDVLHMLCCDEDMLLQSGWARHRDKLLADGTITQKDIDDEKLKPEVATKLAKLKIK